MDIKELAQSPYLAITGRVQKFVESDVKYTMPISCTVYALDTSEAFTNLDYLSTISDAFEYTALALKYGAGVKIQLGNYRLPPQKYSKKTPWLWYLADSHEDWKVVEGKQLPKYLAKSLATKELVENVKILSGGINAPVSMKGVMYHYIQVQDTMKREDLTENQVSICTAFKLLLNCLYHGVIPIIDLSLLRPYGSLSPSGMKATGVFGDYSLTKDLDSGSFLSIYWRLFNHYKSPGLATLLQIFGQINKTIHRGGYLKSGIVCTGMDYSSPLAVKYLKTPLAGLTGNQKKAMRIDAGLFSDEYSHLIPLIVDKVNSESMFLEKIQAADSEGKQLYSNVCVEILQRHKATCLLSHVNGGQIKQPEDLIKAIVDVTKFVYAVHSTWRSQVTPAMANLFIPASEDKQIGVGFVGLANMLAHMGISYEEHIASLENLIKKRISLPHKEYMLYPNQYPYMSLSDKVAYSLYWGYYKAAKFLADKNIDRAFTMAPTQSVAYKYKDLEGNTLSRSIDPPTSKRVRRSSERVKTQWVFHGKNIETAKNLSPELHQLHWELWQEIMNIAAIDAVGKSLSHTMSFDLWANIDEQWLEDFYYSSPLQTTYYNFANTIDQSYLNKGVIQEVVQDMPVEEPKACGLKPPSSENEFCSVCAE